MPNLTINIDATGLAQALALVPIVQITVPAANLTYVYNGAVQFGLTRIGSTAKNRTLDRNDLAPVTGTGVVATVVAMDADVLAQVTTVASGKGMTNEQIGSAAMRTGLSLLSGIDPGPYTIEGVSRQFLPCVVP